MYKDLIIVIENETYESVVSSLIKLNINYDNLKLLDKKIYLKINSKDYEKLSKNICCKKVKYLGKKGFKNFVNKHYLLMLSFLFALLVIYFFSNIIFSIEIDTDNNELKESINESLAKNGVEKYKFVKSYEEIKEIKENILKENEDTLEWIEIERIGTKYKISLTPRVIKEDNKVLNKSSIYADKDGLIKYIIVNEGVKVKEVNELVKKGDELISGNIIKDEKIIDQVHAKGKVYAEVWYTTNIVVPFKHVVYEKTDKVINHVYLSIFGKKFTLMGKFETNNSMNNETVLVEKPYLFFKIINEKKELYNYKEVNLTKEEARVEALKRSDKGISDKLSVDEYIIDKKVLKIKEYSSKIELEIFYRVYESIGIEKEIPLITEGE